MPAPEGAVMDGPWTDYAAVPVPPPQDGPWNDYKPQGAAPAQTEVDTAPPPPQAPPTRSPSPAQDSISAYEPSLLNQARDAFANSAIGRSVQSTMPKVAGALNLRPSESLASPTYQQHGEQLLAPEYLAPALGEAIGSRKTGQPAQANTPGQNRLEGSLEELGSLTDKTNLALGVGTAAAGGLTAGFINPSSARLLSRLIGAGFSLQMLQSLYRQHKGYRQAVDSGDLARAQQIQGAMGVTGVLALLSGAHAARGGGEPAGVPAEQPSPANGPWNDYAADTTRTFTAAANKEGRPIVQGSSDADAIRASAAEQQPTLKATIQGAVAGVPGAEVDGSRVKEAESQQNKADRGKPIETQSDHLGVRIAADSPAAAAQAETAIAQDHTITSTEPLTTNGLEGTQVFVQSGKPGDANQVSEVQILPTAQVRAMEETEPLYEKEKKALAAGNDAQAERLAEEAKAIHQEALHPEKEAEKPASSNQTKGESGKSPEPANVTAGETPAVAPLKLAKGSAVALDDGRTGTINFYPWDPKGRARLTLADGSRLPSVPVDKLTPIPSPESTGGKWIGVDLDGTLSRFDGFKGATQIGVPIQAMVNRVRGWLAEGKDVRILTARVADDPTGAVRSAIQQWSEEFLGRRLPVTNAKDGSMEQLWDDRAIQVVRNTGETVGSQHVDLGGTGGYTSTHDPRVDTKDVRDEEKNVRERGDKAVESGGKETRRGSEADGSNPQGKLRPKEPREEVPAREIHANSDTERVGGGASSSVAAVSGKDSKDGRARTPQERGPAGQPVGEPGTDAGVVARETTRKGKEPSAETPVQEAAREPVVSGARPVREVPKDSDEARKQGHVHELLPQDEGLGKEDSIAPGDVGRDILNPKSKSVQEEENARSVKSKDGEENEARVKAASLDNGTPAEEVKRTLFEGAVEPDAKTTKEASDLGALFHSGFADPELFKRLFPDVAQRVDDWVRDEPTEGTKQCAMMRQTRGEMDRRVAGAMQKLSGAMREWRSRPREDSIAFWNAVEAGDVESLPAKDRALAGTFKGAFDQMKQEIQQLKPEVLRNYIENYFPHLWERPSVVGDAMRAILTGKRPFAGKASFLKQRTIPTMQDGLNLGFKPKTWNPVESFLLKYSEMAQFLMGHQTLAMMKEAGTARFVGIGQKSPIGWTQIDDRIGTVYGNPDIPVTEYFDKQVWAALQQTARNMLVETTRKMNIGGTRLGYYSLLDGIVTKTATPLDTLAHELGHAIDEAYGLKEKLVKDKQFKQELRDLADLRFEGEDSPSPYYKKYVRKGEEKMAAIFQAYVHTPERLQEVAPNTFRHIREFLGEHEELEPLLNLKRGLTYKARQDTVYAGGIVTTGHYYAPADAARAFNNYVSRGMAGRSGVYDVLNWTNQNLNALQLGVSAFHAATTTINAATSDVALGLQQLAEGKPLKAGASVAKGATIVPSLVSTVRNGGRMMKEYLDPGSYEKFEAEADAMAEAGGRIRQNVIEIKPLDRVINAWRNGAAKEGLTHLPAALLDASVRPVMEYYVPRMKMGAFYAMAHDILEQAGKHEWSPDEVRSRMQKAWDSVDNRFGQMVYDNLFWHKGVRDALQLATRSVGWNFGDLRELGGAATDTVREGAKAMGGEMPELTPRMAFGLALPMVSALLGGVLTYLWTGRKPDTWKDYFYPKTADGTRHSIPGYMKDVFAFVHAPVQTTLNKLGPVWEMSAEAINNRDFYGTEIRHPDDPMIHQLGQFATWAGKEAIPFSFSSGAKLLEQRGAEPTLSSMIEHTKKNPGDLVLGQLGFQQAPGFMQNSAAMNKALEYGREDRPPGTKTKQESDHSRAYQAVVKMYRSGKIDRQQVDRYRKEGLLPGPSIARAAMDARYPPIVLASRSLHLEQFLNVYAVASPAEQEQLRPLLATKGRQLEQIPEGPQRDKVLEAYERAISVKTSGPLRASTHP